MTWPDLPASTVVADVLGTTVVFGQRSGMLARVDTVGAFVLRNREHFADHADAAAELTELLGADAAQVDADLIALETLLDELDDEQPAIIDDDAGPRRDPPPASHPPTSWQLDALGVPIEVCSHSASLDAVLGPLLAAHPPSTAAPAHRFEVWGDDLGRVTVTRDRRALHDDVPVDTAVNGLIAGITVAAILTPRSTLLLHAGAVVEAGRAVLIGGGSGAGKSTTTMELVAGGMGFVTDELVELDPASGDVRGLARPLGLEGPARHWRPELRPSWLAHGAEAERWAVPPSSLGAVAERGVLDLVIHLEFALTEAAAVEPIEPMEALGRLCGLTFNRAQVSAAALVQLADLLSRVPSAVVRHGGAPHAARAITERWRELADAVRH